jgi:hypothetical protein
MVGLAIEGDLMDALADGVLYAFVSFGTNLHKSTPSANASIKSPSIARPTMCDRTCQVA